MRHRFQNSSTVTLTECVTTNVPPIHVQRPEIGGHARIGDPTDLVGGGSFRLTRASDTAVPEPSTMLLVPPGLIAALAYRRKRNA